MKLIRIIFLFSLAAHCNAASLFDIELNTSGLIGHPAGPFSLELQLTDGSGIGNATAAVSLSDFRFGGGGVLGAPTLIGGAAGDLSSSVTLTDSFFFNQFAQSFSPGVYLRFRLSLSGVVETGIPDGFSLAILDSAMAEIPTLGPLNALLLVDLTSETPPIEVFETDSTVPPFGGGPGIVMPAPTVTDSAVVPEPSSFAVALGGICALLLLRQIRKLRFAGAALNSFDGFPRGCTGDTAKVRLLLERGAEVNAKTKDGTTALVTAARRGNTDSVKLLLAHGGDPKASANNGIGIKINGRSPP